MSIGQIYLTKRGRNLIAKGIGGQQIIFTRFGIGDGRLNGQAVEDLNNLLGFKKTVPIGQKKFKDTGILQLYGNLSNSEMGGFYFRELGLFATDPDLGEILYCYGNAGDMAEYIPVFQEEVYEKTILLNAYHGNAENVMATIDESLVYATKEEVNELCISLLDKAEKDLGNVSPEAFRSAFVASGIGTEVADKATIDKVDENVSAIETTIGNTSDTPSSSIMTGSLFAKVNYVVVQIRDYLASIYVRIGTPTDGANNSTGSNLHQKINWILQRFGSYWTDARAVKIDTIDGKTGVTTDAVATETTGTVMGKLNTLLKRFIDNWTVTRAVKIDNLDTTVSSRASSQEVNSNTNGLADVKKMLAGYQDAFGNASLRDYVASNSNWAMKDVFGRYIFQCESFHLPEGLIFRPPTTSKGVYIYSQTDIVIDGELSTVSMGDFSGSNPVNYVTINGIDYTLAKCGDTVPGGKSGDAGVATKRMTFWTYTSGLGITPSQSYQGDHCIGGTGQYTSMATGFTECTSSTTGTSTEKAGVNSALLSNPTTTTCAVILVAKGNIIINGIINCRGVNGKPAGNGSNSYYSNSSGTPYVFAGDGGKGAVSPSGGGGITLIAKNIKINGRCITSGYKYTTSNGSNGAGYSNENCVVEGGKGGLGGTFISTTGEIKAYTLPQE